MPLFAGAALLAIGVAVVGWAAVVVMQPPGTVIVVRHAEKAAAPADDPVLSPLGRGRAEALAEFLAPARIDAVYASQYQRTDATAAPLAARLSLPVQRYEADDVPGLVDALKRRHRGDTVLVVGHSNTVPEIVRELSGRDIGEITEDRYGDVFIVTVPRWGRATVTRLFQAR